MKQSVFLIAHPRDFAPDAEFMSDVKLTSEFGELLEIIDVFCINAENFETCSSLLLNTKNKLQALQTEAKTELTDKWQNQIQAIAKFENALRLIEAEGPVLITDECPDSLKRCVSDATRMRCDRGWSLYLTDKTT